jgi:phthalate 4,5-dioxygenase oxygenase subunit
VDYVHTANFVFPFYCIVPPRSHAHVHLYVPIDDEHTWDYSVYYSQARAIVHEAMLRRRRVMPGVDLFPDRRRKRNMSNQLLQDRVAMRERRSFTGIDDNPHEDEGIQESMGPICDRWNEHLGATDAAVIHLRQRLLDAVRALAAAKPPPGLQGGIAWDQIRSYRKLVPKGFPWERLGEHESEDLLPGYAVEVTV